MSRQVTASVLLAVLCLWFIVQFLPWGGSLEFREPLPKSYLGGSLKFQEQINQTYLGGSLKFQEQVNQSNRDSLTQVTCTNVSQEMTRGHWVQNNFTLDQLKEIEAFLRRARAYHKFPADLQRDDKKCGDVNFPGTDWSRAVCNPNGSTPCCWETSCVAKSVEQCRCPRCYDMRQQIHAELATWVPDNPKCQMALLSRQQICQLLTNMTIYFIGDSLMRQMFMSVFGLLRDDILLDSTPQANRNICDHYNRYFTDCTPHILRDSRECEGEVHLMSQSLWRASQSKNILEVMGQLTGKNNSLFVFGIGLHDGLDHNVVESQVLKPMFELMSKSPWPKVIWVTPHVPGPLKSGRYVHQQAAKMEVYNQVMHQVMRKQGIPVLDFLHLTDGVMSYDGTHFGKGLNDVKAHIFLNFLLENRKHFVHNV